jgi:hypothetical protein
MTDDRSLERTARSWIDEGPTRAPERAVDRALQLIQTTPQERDLLILRRLPTMNPIARVAGAVAIAVIAVGVVLVAVRPAANVGVAPTPNAPASSLANPSPDAAAALIAYRQARDAVCVPLSSASPPPGVDPHADPAGAVAALRLVLDRGSVEATRLEAIQAPPNIETEHLANIQTLKDTMALLSHEIDLIQAGKPDEAATVDQATAPLSSIFEQFEAKYGLQPCP